MARELRERIVGELAEKYRETRHCVFVDFSGLNVEAMRELRQQMRKKGIELFVTKNSLLKLALEKVGLPASEELFNRPTAVVSGGEDPVAICKLVVGWGKKAKTVGIKGGLLDGKLLTGGQVEELSKLPPREALLSQILWVFIAPLTDIASLFDSTVRQVASLLHNHIEKLEEKG